VRFSEAVVRTARQLEAAGLSYGQGFQDADDEALRIAYAASGLEFSACLSDDNIPHELLLTDDAISIIATITHERIASRQPLAYILKEAWFSGNRFYIDERAIIPRSYFSEWIPDQFQPWVDPVQVRTILDMCCGSGCMGICCALAFPDAVVLASDNSSDALDVASRNISDYGLQQRIRLNHGNMFEGIEERFDLIVCNPPYVSADRFMALPPEYCKEPDVAFRAGADGLDFILEMLLESGKYLTANGIIVVESGTASAKLEEFLDDVPFVWLSTEFDEKVLFLLEADQIRTARNKIIRLLEIRNPASVSSD